MPRSPSTSPTPPNSPRRSPSSQTGYPAASNRPSRRAWPPSSATRLRHRDPPRRPAPVRLPPRRNRRRGTLRRANAMTTNTGAARPLDRITRITPNICPLDSVGLHVCRTHIVQFCFSSGQGDAQEVRPGLPGGRGAAGPGDLRGDRPLARPTNSAAGHRPGLGQAMATGPAG